MVEMKDGTERARFLEGYLGGLNKARFSWLGKGLAILSVVVADIWECTSPCELQELPIFFLFLHC